MHINLVYAIPTETPVTLAKEIIDIPPLVGNKTVRVCRNNQRQQCIYLVFYLLLFFLEFRN